MVGWNCKGDPWDLEFHSLGDWNLNSTCLTHLWSSTNLCFPFYDLAVVIDLSNFKFSFHLCLRKSTQFPILLNVCSESQWILLVSFCSCYCVVHCFCLTTWCLWIKIKCWVHCGLRGKQISTFMHNRKERGKKLLLQEMKEHFKPD